MKYHSLLLAGLLSVSISASNATELDWNNLRSEILIHLGLTGYRTNTIEGTRRDDAGQLGYDIKLGYDISGFRPFLLLSGHRVINTFHSEIGIGSYYFLKKSEFQLDFTRKREKLLQINGESFLGELVLYKVRAIWSYPIKRFETFDLKTILGFGNNTHGEKKIFKLNRGKYFLAGLRIHFLDEDNSKESFLTELHWQQDTIKSQSLKQERNSVIFRVGKRF